MTQADILAQTRQHLAELFGAEASGHDYWHMERTARLALHLAKLEKADLFITELGALLHDIADFKFNGGDDTAGPKAARAWLESLRLDEPSIRQIESIVSTTSFKGAGVKVTPERLEGKIVSDADKIDALGAMGIARTFAYGGMTGRPIYDPAIKPILHDNFEAYKNSASPSINHFYEKLLLLKDNLFTESGRAIATHRHQFMEAFLREFYDEWEGKL